MFDGLRSDPRVWHFAFHGARDLPELLVQGRERQYLQYFFDARTTDPSATDVDEYAQAYSAPGAMRAGFELYRAFDQDASDNRAALAANGKLDVPVLAIGGEISTTGPLMEEMLREVAHDVTGRVIPGTAHWVPEESPRGLRRRGRHLHHARRLGLREARLVVGGDVVEDFLDDVLGGLARDVLELRALGRVHVLLGGEVALLDVGQELAVVHVEHALDLG